MKENDEYQIEFKLSFSVVLSSTFVVFKPGKKTPQLLLYSLFFEFLQLKTEEEDFSKIFIVINVTQRNIDINNKV